MKFRTKNRKNLRSTKKMILWGNQKERRGEVSKIYKPQQDKEKKIEKRQITTTGMKWVITTDPTDVKRVRSKSYQVTT